MTENEIFEDGDIDELLNIEKKPKKKKKSKKKPKAEIQVSQKIEPEPEPEVMAKAPEHKMPVRGAGGKIRKYYPGQMKTITIQKERIKGGDLPVPVCYNGRQYTVPRGVRVEVPAPVAEILLNAEENIMEWMPDSNSIEGRPAASYPTAVHD